MKEKNKYVQLGLMIFGIVAGAILLFFFVFYIKDIVAFIKKVIGILAPLNIGIAIAYLINPIVALFNGALLKLLAHTKLQMKTRKKIAKGVSIATALMVLIALVVALLYTVIPEVTDSLTALVNNLQGYATSFYGFATDLFEFNPDIQAEVEKTLNGSLESFTNWIRTDILGQAKDLLLSLSNGIVGAFKIIINIILGLCVAVYLLVSKNRFIGGFKKLLYATFKKETVNVILAVGREADSIFGGFISGKLLDSLIIGILCFIGCSIMKMPYLVLISVVIGVTNIVPIFGPWVGAIPCSLLVLIIDPGKALIFVIFVVALQQFDGNILGPNILGDSTGLSALWVVFAITLGGGLFKVPGMILGVPTFAVIYFLVKTYVEFKLKENNMPIQTISYTKIKRIDPDTLNSEYLTSNLSKKERRKQNVFADDVSREIAIAARLARAEKGKKGIMAFGNNTEQEGTESEENEDD